MNITIKLTKNTVPCLSGPFKAKENEDITFNFKTNYVLHSAKIEVKNGNICEEFDYCQSFTIPEKFMFAGNLFVTVKMLIRNNVAKRWEIMPIKIIQTPEGLYLVDFLTSLDERLKVIEKFHEII